MPLKILHCITSLHSDGAQQMLLKLSEWRSRDQVEFVVVSLMSNGALEKQLERAGVKVFSLGMRRRLPTPGAVLRLCRLIDTERPDIIQGWMYHGNLAVSVAQKFRRGSEPVLWNIRRSLYDIREDHLFKRAVIHLNAKLSAWPERIIYCGEICAQQHEAFGFSREKRLVIPNGFDTQRFRPNPEARARLREMLGVGPQTRVVGMVGRFHPQKDHRNFLETAGRVAKSAPDTAFVLVGREMTNENETLREWARSAGLGPQLHLLGERRDVADLVCGFDIFCLSSVNEGFPNVVGEAMSCGVPCAVTEVSAAPEIVGDTGLVAPRRDPERLAAAVLKLLELSPEARQRLGLEARKRVESCFTIDSVARRYEAEYLRVTAAQRAAASSASR